MAKYRNNLPQIDGSLFLTDGGLETVLCFDRDIDLPEFCAFPLIDTDAGRREIMDYMRKHAEIAVNGGTGFVMETPTWRASSGWADKIGFPKERLGEINRRAVSMMADLRDEFETADSKFVISGNIGPQGDGYNPEKLLTVEEAIGYHSEQINTFAGAGADLVTALTMTHVEEAIGITLAAQAAEIPVVISFTTETDGKLPSGQALGDALKTVDEKTDNGPVYFMLNCAHTTHFDDALKNGEEWVTRIRGIRANASSKSHEELDNSEVLDDGNPEEFGAQYREIREFMPQVTVLGGCCGTDHRHVEAVYTACTA